MRKVQCTRNSASEERASAAQRRRKHPRGTATDSGDSGTGPGAYERSPTVSTSMGVGTTTGNPYGQSRTPTMSGNPYGRGLTPSMSGSPYGQSLAPSMSGSPYGRGLTPSMSGNMSHGSNQTSPFVTTATHLPSDPTYNYLMEPANYGADMAQAFGNPEGNASEGRAWTALDPRLAYMAWEHEYQEPIFYEGL